MATTNENIVDKINTYFDNSSYSELYSNDIWFTIIAFIVVIFIAFYFFITSTIKSYKNSWQQNKCNPLLMPFASVINSEESKGNELDYIINNFNECLNTLNAELAQQAKKPIDSVTLSIEGIFGSIHASFIEVQNFIVYLYNLILEFFTLIMNKLEIILENVKYFFMNTNDFLSKILSAITVGYYTLVLLIQAFKSIFVVFVLGWLLTMVIPASMMVVGLITILIIVVMIFSMLMSIPLLGPLLAALLIGVIIAYTISFLVAVVYLIIVCLLYGLFNRFVEKVFL
jgi:predicted PurR-regulated permease PerM